MRISSNGCSGVTYALGQSLYIALTCRCNSVTLPESRGPNFTLPIRIVSALQTLRIQELKDYYKNTTASIDLLQNIDSNKQESVKVSSILPPLPKVVVLNYNTTLYDDELSELIMESLHQNMESVVFAGEGEPTLRLPMLLSISRAIRDKHKNLPIRITTNGLIIPCDNKNNNNNVLERIKQAGVTSLSVALMTSCQDQYIELMNPLLLHDNIIHPHYAICQLVQSAVAHGFDVEVTGVDRPEVDKVKAQELALHLGVVTPFRWRSYFP